MGPLPGSMLPVQQHPGRLRSGSDIVTAVSAEIRDGPNFWIGSFSADHLPFENVRCSSLQLPLRASDVTQRAAPVTRRADAAILPSLREMRIG